MRSRGVSAEQTVTLAAPAERAWSLVGGASAWSARPGLFAFDIQEFVPQSRQLTCVLGSPGSVTGAWVYECWRQDEPEQVITWRLRGHSPSAERSYTVSIRPAANGVRICAAAHHPPARQASGSLSRHLRNELRAWLVGLRLILEGQLPWPASEIPLAVARACAARPELALVTTASASALIAASPAQVWEAMLAPELSSKLDHEVVAAGRVAGTPPQAVGEMQYDISDLPDGRIVARVHVIHELAFQQRLVTSHVGPPYDQTETRISAEQGGTRLQLIGRRTEEDAQQGRSDAARLRALVDGCKELIENP